MPPLMGAAVRVTCSEVNRLLAALMHTIGLLPAWPSKPAWHFLSIWAPQRHTCDVRSPFNSEVLS